MNDLWGNKFVGGKQLYCEMWEMGINLPHHFPLLVKLLRFALEHLNVPDPTETSYL